MNKGDIASRFCDTLGDVYDACTFIDEAGACDRCPMLWNCMKDNCLLDFANFCTRRDIEEMLDLAADVEDYVDEQDYIASQADMQRKDELWTGY